MTYRLVIRPAAEDDLEEASAWYERQRPGLGREFLAVDETLEKIAKHPDFGIVVHKQLRRANVQRFPYGVFYFLDQQRIIVAGVLHGRRAPRAWKSRAE